MSAFVAIRPVSTVAYVTARLKASVLSVLAAWLVVATVVGVTLTFPAHSGLRSGMIGHLLLMHIAPHMRALAILSVVLVIVLSCKFQADSLFLELCGEQRLVYGYCAAAFLVVIPFVLVLVSCFTAGRTGMATGEAILRNTLAIAVLLKAAAGALVLRKLVARGILVQRQLIRLGGAWGLAWLVLFTLLVLIVPRTLATPIALSATAFLMIPLVRLGLAPLAWAWNRHR